MNADLLRRLPIVNSNCSAKLHHLHRGIEAFEAHIHFYCIALKFFPRVRELSENISTNNSRVFSVSNCYCLFISVALQNVRHYYGERLYVCRVFECCLDAIEYYRHTQYENFFRCCASTTQPDWSSSVRTTTSSSNFSGWMYG